MPPTEALERLLAGNDRFVAGERATSSRGRLDALGEQRPFAALLSCADSRVPVELIFAQGFGDLFVVRVAGNVAGVTQTGSIEFAVEQLGVRLVVVLGHEGCGAVRAGLQALDGQLQRAPPTLGAIVDFVRPALVEAGLSADGGITAHLLDQAVAANVHAAVNSLRFGSRLIADRLNSGQLLVLGAIYSMTTGAVKILP